MCVNVRGYGLILNRYLCCVKDVDVSFFQFLTVIVNVGPWSSVSRANCFIIKRTINSRHHFLQLSSFRGCPELLFKSYKLPFKIVKNPYSVFSSHGNLLRRKMDNNKGHISQILIGLKKSQRKQCI